MLLANPAYFLSNMMRKPYLSGGTYSAPELSNITGIAVALVCGKPIGIVGISWICVKLKWCNLPDGMTWKGIWLVSLLT